MLHTKVAFQIWGQSFLPSLYRSTTCMFPSWTLQMIPMRYHWMNLFTGLFNYLASIRDLSFGVLC